MPIIRIKDNVPQNYVAESRDFQLFTRVLDFVQNSTKFDIDSMANILDTDTIPDNYMDRLKSKLGFFTSNKYDVYTLRKILNAFPHIIKYKGSEEGIEKCVNTFLNILGIRNGCKIDIYNNDIMYDHTVRVGINTQITDTQALKDMLSYILPTGYFVEIYFYTDATSKPTKSIFKSEQPYTLQDYDYSIRSSKLENKLDNDTYNMVQLSTLHDPESEVKNNG